MKPLSITYSLADQDFARTKSIGIFNLSLQLAGALAREPRLDRFTVLANHTLNTVLNLAPQTRLEQCDHAIRGRGGRILWDQWRVYSEAKRTNNEWLLLPKGFASFLRPPPVRLAAYIHDMMHEVYASEYPGQMPAIESHYFRWSMLATIRSADLIFTNTEFTAQEVRRVADKYSLSIPRIYCAGIGFEGQPSLNTPKQNRIVVLVSRWPHKRSRMAIEWLCRWQDESGFDGGIDLVGGLPADVHRPSRASWLHSERLGETKYRELLQQARALVYFSGHEGFGMPPVEALVAGTCPVFSSLPATLETMAGAGLAFFNNDYESFKHAMDRALNIMPETISKWAEQVLALHQWSQVAERVVTAMREAT